MATFRYYKLTANNDADYIPLIRDKLVLEGWDLLVDNGTSIIVRPAGTENYYKIFFKDYGDGDGRGFIFVEFSNAFDGTDITNVISLSLYSTSYDVYKNKYFIIDLNLFINSNICFFGWHTKLLKYDNSLVINDYFHHCFFGKVETDDAIYSGIYDSPNYRWYYGTSSIFDEVPPYMTYYTQDYYSCVFNYKNNVFIRRYDILALPYINYYNSFSTASKYDFLHNNGYKVNTIQMSRQPTSQGKRVLSKVLVYGQEEVNSVIYYYPVATLPFYLTYIYGDSDYLNKIVYNNRTFLIFPLGVHIIPNANDSYDLSGFITYPYYAWAIEVDNI